MPATVRRRGSTPPSHSRGQGVARLTGVDVSTAAVFESDRREQASGLPDTFEQRTRAAGPPGVFRTADGSDEAGRKGLYAHYADLVIAPTDALFSCVSEEGADLIVAGGSGRSRPLEHVFEGVSEELVNNITAQVLICP